MQIEIEIEIGIIMKGNVTETGTQTGRETEEIGEIEIGKEKGIGTEVD